MNEITPLHVHDTISVSYQLFVAFGILLAQILGLEGILGRQHLWNYLFGMICCSYLNVLVLFFLLSVNSCANYLQHSSMYFIDIYP